MAKKRAAQKAPKGASASSGDNSTLLAFIGVFLAVVGFLIVYLVKKEDDYAMHYAKQGLALFIVAVIVWVANRVLMIVPVLGSIVSTVLGIGLLVLWIVGIIYSFSGEKKDIPLIGELAKKLNL